MLSVSIAQGQRAPRVTARAFQWIRLRLGSGGRPAAGVRGTWGDALCLERARNACSSIWRWGSAV